jgi:hypothetical protein
VFILPQISASASGGFCGDINEVYSSKVSLRQHSCGLRGLFSFSGEVEASAKAVADHGCSRRSQGLTCFFTLFWVLSVVWRQLFRVWTVLVFSCCPYLI